MKVGCDVAEVARFENLSQAFMHKYFTEYERKYILSKHCMRQAETTAGIFCVKESVLKALGIGLGNGISLLDIEVTHDEFNAPKVTVNNKIAHGKKFEVSISHTATTAFAVVIMN